MGVQFLYGEDGVDVTRASHLTKFNILHDNFHVLEAAHDAGLAHLHEPSSSVDVECASLYRAASTAAMGGETDKAVKLIEKFKTEALSPSVKHSLKAARKKLKYHGETALDPVASVLDPAHYYGSTSEVHEKKLLDYVAEAGLKGKEAEKFMKHMRLKFMQCLAEPGRAEHTNDAEYIPSCWPRRCERHPGDSPFERDHSDFLSEHQDPDSEHEGSARRHRVFVSGGQASVCQQISCAL